MDAYGLPVIGWPPLYPLLLAAVQGVTGVSVLGITIATATLLAATVLSWHLLWRWLAATQGMQPASSRLATLWTALILVHHTRGLRSEALLHLLLPGIVWLALLACRAQGRRQFCWRLLWLWCLLAVGIATRQSAAIFAIGAVVLALRAPAVDWPTRLLACAVLLLATFACKQIIELWLGLTPHPLGFGFGEYSALEYLGQLFRGLGRNLGETVSGLLLLSVLTWRSRHSAVARQILCFSGVGLATLFLLFNLMSITDQLRGRMTLFAVLLVVGNGLLLVPTQLGRRARWLLLAVLFAAPAAKVGKYLWLGRGPTVFDFSDRAALGSFLPANAIIDKSHIGKPALQIGTKVLISPPLFPWIEQRLRDLRDLRDR